MGQGQLMFPISVFLCRQQDEKIHSHLVRLAGDRRKQNRIKSGSASHGWERRTCSLISFIFSTFFSLVAYSWTSFSPMSVHSLTRKRRPGKHSFWFFKLSLHWSVVANHLVMVKGSAGVWASNRMNYIQCFLGTCGECPYMSPELSGSFLWREKK